MQGAAARALGELGDPSAVMPLYELASDLATEPWLRQYARRSLEQLGFQRREESGPPAILAWVAGLLLIAGGLALATVAGAVAIVPVLAGVGVIMAYYARESRRASYGGGWYVDGAGGEFYFPGDTPSGGGWFGDVFGGGDGGGGGNGG